MPSTSDTPKTEAETETQTVECSQCSQEMDKKTMLFIVWIAAIISLSGCALISTLVVPNIYVPPLVVFILGGGVALLKMFKWI